MTNHTNNNENDDAGSKITPDIYWAASTSGILSFFAGLPSTWYFGADAAKYAAEKDRLHRYVLPFYGGIGAAVIVWANFRLRRRPPPQFADAAKQAAQQSLDRLTDVLISAAVGVSSTLFLLNGEVPTMRKDWETAPLVPGRSLAARTICPAVQAVPQSGATEMNDDVRSFQRFLHNCRRRQQREQDIRERLGWPQTQDVDIPYPGLSEADDDGPAFR
uniref:Uncharacterized protein n=1 Tax=Craspedostauros australis TaxID=1486917 RepID=A0A7R9WQI3_9STRA